MKNEHAGQLLLVSILGLLFGTKRFAQNRMKSGSFSSGNGEDDEIFNIYVGKPESQINEDDRRRMAMASMSTLADDLISRQEGDDKLITLFQKPAIPQDIREMRAYVRECQPIIEEYAKRSVHVVGQKENLPTIEINREHYDLFEASLIAKEVDKKGEQDYEKMMLRRKLMRSYGAGVEGILRRYDLGPKIMSNYK